VLEHAIHALAVTVPPRAHVTVTGDERLTFEIWSACSGNPKEVSIRAGHSSVGFTLDRYGHLYEDQDDDVPDRLDELLSSRHASSSRPDRTARSELVRGQHSDQGIYEWPQRDLNPCYRLERAAS
jgi:hypothetical protein